MHLTDKAFPLDDSYSDTLRFISLIPRATALPPASVEVVPDITLSNQVVCM